MYLEINLMYDCLLFLLNLIDFYILITARFVLHSNDIIEDSTSQYVRMFNNFIFVNYYI